MQKEEKPPEFIDPFAGLEQKFNRLPMWSRISLAVALFAAQIHEMTRQRAANDPQRAEILTMLILFAVLLVANELLKPKPKVEDARPAGLGDFKFPTATEGRVVPLVWGTVICEGPNVIWYGDFVQEPITKKIKGSLFSGGKRFIAGFRYYIAFQAALCRGPIDNLRRIWIGDTVVFNGSQGEGTLTINEPTLFGGDDTGNGGVVGTVTVRVGSQAQPADSYLSAFQSVGGTTPRYVGTCYIVFQRGLLGNSTSIKPWKFEVRRIPNGLGLSSGAALNGGNDCNPMNVIYELLTNTEWGFGFNASDIDLTNFTTNAATLAAENNGFSFLLDNAIEAADFLREIERQIDGICFLDHRTGKWKVTLCRNDYDINTVPEITVDNRIELVDFARASWDETTNQVRVKYDQRDKDYKESYAFAQDMANAMIQGGGTVTSGVNVTATIAMPGVKDPALANSIAWRELAQLSAPLAKATVVVDRTFWDRVPGNVLAFTDARLGLTKLPMRILKADYGELEDGKIQLDLVQDVFQFAQPSFGTPQGTRWTAPDDNLLPFTDTRVFEAPRAFLIRDEDNGGALIDRVYATAARRGNEVGFKIAARVSPAAYTEQGEVYGIAFKCTLNGALNRGAQVPGTVTITAANASDKLRILQLLGTGTAQEIGTSLINLMIIEDEFVLPTSGASGASNDVTLNSVYRGVLDSVQADHANGAAVWLLFVAGGLSSAQTPSTTVDVKPLPFSRFDQVLETAVTATSIAMDNRLRRPYPPGGLSLNGAAQDTTLVSLEGGAGSGDADGIDVVLTRRDLRTTNEVQALTVDAATTFPDFPTLNTTEYRIEVVNITGSPTSLYFTAWGSSASITLRRVDILRFTLGVIPTSLRISVETRHTYETVLRTARVDLDWDFTTATALTGQFNFGALAQNAVSAVYTATQAGTYNFSINTALATGNVQARINGGAFATVISTGNTSGSLAGVVVSDTIEIRHTSSTGGTLTMVFMDAPSSGQDAYGVLYQ